VNYKVVKVNLVNRISNFLLAPLGRSAPHRHYQKFVSLSVWMVKKKSDQFSRHCQAILSTFFFLLRKKPPKTQSPGGRGVPQIFFYYKAYFYFLKPHAKFRNPTINPSWRKVSEGGERKRKEILSKFAKNQMAA
jgi:hypothetical protein